MAEATIDASWLRRAFADARTGLAAEALTINDLNVFPVPDGDTGSNLVRTWEAACEAVDALPRAADLAEVGGAAAQGALMGARGNSGVIVSQLLRGFAQELGGDGGLDPGQLAAALTRAAEVARQAVLQPKPGTILTVADDAAEAGRVAVTSGRATPRTVLAAAAAEAWAAVERTPAQLPVLAHAGVVDAGGYGLAVVLTAFARAAGANGARPPRMPPTPSRAGRIGPMALAVPARGHGYCTEFQIVGASEGADGVRARLAAAADLGDSALVVGDPGRVHVHVHTPVPWDLLAAAARVGGIERLSVQDMTAQHRAARQPPATRRAGVGVVAVAPGPGFRAILLDLGAAAVVAGGPRMHPSTEDLLEAVRAVDADAVVLLPNHPDVLLAAQQAARLAGDRVAVVPSRNVPQGIAALLALDPARDLGATCSRMGRAITQVDVIELTTAVRDATQDGHVIHTGDVLALADGRIVARGADLAEVALAALAQRGAAQRELITLYRGADGAPDPERLEAAIRQRFPHLEVERQEGGQPLYPFVISAE